MSEPEPLPPPVYTVADEDLFRDLTVEQRAEIERSISYAEYPTGHLFYAPEDDGERIYLLQRGRIRIYKLSLEGRALTLLILEPVSIFGEMALADDWLHDSFAETLTDCSVGTLRRSALRQIMSRYPSVALRFMRVMTTRLRAMEHKLADIAFKSVPQRLATVLLGLADTHASGRGGPPTVVRYTHQQLAEMIGSYRETVTKAIGDFREAGLIQVQDESIYLTDITRLRALVGIVT
ncbi:MAG: Crp/Fnr family transcriptional regulator [Roseiflexaceae bacterium]|nr:Crp/Fnr family transcriptional regulator [Roseiflexaceae bacterium]